MHKEDKQHPISHSHFQQYKNSYFKYVIIFLLYHTFWRSMEASDGLCLDSFGLHLFELILHLLHFNCLDIAFYKWSGHYPKHKQEFTRY